MKKIFFLLSVLILFTIAVPAQAGLFSQGVKSSINDQSASFNSSAGFENMSAVSVVKMIIVTLLSILAVVFLAFIIYAGFKWMMAAGDAEDIKKAKSTIFNAIIGLIIVLSSYAITYFVFNNLPFDGTPPTQSSTNSGNLGL